MDGFTRREALAAVGTVGGIGLAGCLGNDGDGTTTEDGPESGSDSEGENDPEASWRDVSLSDVRTDQSFTLAGLEKPVVLETFAVWCSTCLRQQEAMRALQDEVGDAVTSVTLNVDPNEDATRVRTHLEEHGFDWRYAVSPPELTDALVEEFGSTMTVPPRAPVVVVCEDGARRLPDGVKSAGDLRTALDEGC